MQYLSRHGVHRAIDLQQVEQMQSCDQDHPAQPPRPDRATLSEADFWQLQDHRRRREFGGPAEDPVLAAYLRAKLGAARVVTEPKAQSSFVTAGSVVACRIDNHLPRCFRLYHWTPPIQRCAISTGTWLGAVLIGMAQHQVTTLSSPEAGFRRIEILQINAEDFLPSDNRRPRRSYPAHSTYSYL